MDTRIERKSRFKKKHIYSLIGIAVGLLCLLWLLFRDTSSSLKVEKERITIATVQKGEFNDYIWVIGQVLPDRIIYLDAIEGPTVREQPHNLPQPASNLRGPAGSSYTGVRIA